MSSQGIFVFFPSPFRETFSQCRNTGHYSFLPCLLSLRISWGLSQVFSLPGDRGSAYSVVATPLSIFHCLQTLLETECGKQRTMKQDITVKKQSCPATRHGDAWEERMYSSYSFLTSTLDGGEWSASRPGRALPRGKDPRYPLDRRLGGPQSRSGHRG
jgi:hypothetical protein